MDTLFWSYVIYPCSLCTSCNNRGQVSPASTSAHVRWISFTSIFSSPTDLSPLSHWCRMNDECLNIKASKTTFHSPILFYFCPQTGVWTKSRQVCDSVMFISAKLSKGRDFPRPVRLQSYGHCPLWVMILWGGANGRIDGMTSADAY